MTARFRKKSLDDTITKKTRKKPSLNSKKPTKNSQNTIKNSQKTLQKSAKNQ
jgi:hypothetical protein